MKIKNISTTVKTIGCPLIGVTLSEIWLKVEEEDNGNLEYWPIGIKIIKLKN